MARLGIVFILFTFFSCSQLGRVDEAKTQAEQRQKDANGHLTPEQIQALNEKTAKQVSEQLRKLAIAAKASGEEQTRFLASDMYLKGSAAQMEGDFQTANLIFEQLTELVPEDRFVRKKYAVGLIRAGELGKSKEILEALYAERAEEDIGMVLAGVYTSLGEIEPARVVYSGILKEQPAHEDACVFLAKTHLLEKQVKEARKRLASCEKTAPSKGVFSYYLGKIAVEQGELEEAKKLFRRSSKLQPEFSQAIMALGLVYEEQGKKAEAVEIYKKYLRQKPNDTLVLSRLLQLFFSMEKFQEATPYAERLSDLDPQDLNLKVKLGILYTDAKEYQKAIATFKELLLSAPGNDKILYYLGAIYQEVREFENSVDYFTQVPVESGLYQDSSLQAARMLGELALSDEKRFQQRFLNLVAERSQVVPSLQIEFHVIKAGYFERAEQNTRAIASLEDVAENEGFTDNHRYYLASLYEKEGRYQELLPLVEGILERNPDDPYAYNFLGYSILEKGERERFDEAYGYIRKAIELKPDDGYIRDSLGWYYYKVGEVEKALAELEEAARLVPDDVSIQKHLAIVYGELKEYKKAKRFIENAIGLAQYEAERRELLEVLQNFAGDREPAASKLD